MINDLLDRWEDLAKVHGVRTFTGNDHLLFSNELRAALRGVSRMKDHEKRETINRVTDIAITFGHTQQLRERMAGALLPILQEMARLQDEVTQLKGIQPAVPPRPNDGGGLPRFGIRWNGDDLPISTPMTDGYWTPFHLAQKEIHRLEKDINEIVERHTTC